MDLDLKKLVRPEIYNMEVKEYAHAHVEINNLCDMSMNVNPFGVSKKAIKKLNSIGSKVISQYYPENIMLLKKIADYVKVKPNQVMLGDGCDGCLAMIASTFIGKNDEVIIPVPTFHRYEFHTLVMGGKPIFVPMKNFEIDPDDIIENINPRTKLIFLCDPNNPTGLNINNKTKEEIIRNFSGIVVIDQALTDDGVEVTKLLEKYENIVLARSLSKNFGLASLRTGYIISHPEIIAQIRKTSSPFKVSGIAQELAIATFEDYKHRKSSNGFVDKNRNYLIENLRKMGLQCTDSVSSNFLLNVESLNINSLIFKKKLEEKNVIVTDATVFKVPKDTYVRISVSNEKDNERFIKAVKEIVEELKT